MVKNKIMLLSCTFLTSLLALTGCGRTSDSTASNVTSTSTSTSTSTGTGQVEGATGAYNFIAGTVEQKAEILGQLEKYAVSNHLTGYSLFGDGGYSLYSSRINFPTNEYIEGFGWGLAMYGSINANDSHFQISDDDTSISDIKEYYHSYDSTPITSLNYLDDKGSQLSDYSSYFQSGLFSTKLNASKTNYEWYPLLADSMPTPVDLNKSTGLAKTWRFKIKTGKDGVKYTTGSTRDDRKAYNNKDVQPEDYTFALRVLLSSDVGYYRANQYSAGDAEIVGASNYNAASADGMFSDAAKKAWEKVGYKLVDKDGNTYSGSGDCYIQVTYVNPCNEFKSFYRLSDNLLTPINQDFYKLVTGLGTDSFHPEFYMNQDSNGTVGVVDNTLSVGPYYVRQFNGANNGAIVFTRNDNWFERKADSSLYQIKGFKYRFDTGLQDDANGMINHFKARECDSSSIPASAWNDFQDHGEFYVRKLSKNTSNYKMNVNSTTESRWEELFGEAGTITQTSKSQYWKVKPIMSNSNFLDGVYFATDRQTIANNLHKNVSDTYFSDNYMIDPENGVSYNSTQAHKDAVADYQTTDAAGKSTYGFDLSTAQSLFSKALKALTDNGTYKSGDTIQLEAYYQTQTNVEQFGNYWAKTIEDAFNEAGKNYGITLDIVNKYDSVWSDVYYKHLMVGQFDFGFGSISGNSLDPVNFMEVLKSDNSSGFTLNWGVDTSKVSEDLVYDGKTWSFDALFNAANSGAIVQNGEMGKPFIFNDKESLWAEDTSKLVFDYNADLVTESNLQIENVVVSSLIISFVNENSEVESASLSNASATADTEKHTLTVDFDKESFASYFYDGEDENAAYQASEEFYNKLQGKNITISTSLGAYITVNGIDGSYYTLVTGTDSNF